jgi:hypothetical protein
VSVARGQFWKSGKGTSLLEFGTGGLVKDRKPRGLRACIVNCRLRELAIALDCEHQLRGLQKNTIWYDKDGHVLHQD